MGDIKKIDKRISKVKEIKKVDKKSAKQSSELFHSIMAASVKGKPKKKSK